MDGFAAMLSLPVGKPVVDKTGLKGDYDIKLDYAPPDAGADSSLPSIFTALQESLGLKLEPQFVPMKKLFIDRVEKVPAEN